MAKNVLTTDLLEQLWRRAKSQPTGMQPYRDPATGEQFFLLTCAPGSAGARWAEDHPERLRYLESDLGPLVLLPDPDEEPSFWAYLRG